MLCHGHARPRLPALTSRADGAVWAEAAAALRLRRAELLAKQQALQASFEEPHAGDPASAPQATVDPRPTQSPASEHVSVGNGVRSVVASSVATPSVVRPRGGVRQSALGPFLARLRTETES